MKTTKMQRMILEMKNVSQQGFVFPCNQNTYLPLTVNKMAMPLFPVHRANPLENKK